MSKGDNSPGASKLAGVLKGMARRSTEIPLALDFGGIQNDGSLLTNSFPVPIPKSDYQICRYLTYPGNENNTTSGASVGDHGSHTHSVSVVRDKDRKIKAGDRVLVAWVGDDAVVIDIIVPAEEVL